MIGRNVGTILRAGMVCLLAAGLASAQTITINGGEVNISGATLFRSYFSTAASTNDFINANYNFISCSGNPFIGFADTNCNGSADSTDQLATPYSTSGFTTWWLVNYRGVGSVNGTNEFVDYQLLGLLPNNTIPPSSGRINQTTYVGDSGGGFVAPFSAANPPPPQHSIDINVLDVPGAWAVRAGDVTGPAWFRKPTQPGYGHNPLKSYDTSYDNRLATLSRGAISLNQNIATPDANTIFDTPVTYVAIAIVANRGTGLQNVRMSELQTLFLTGRMPSGENLATVTRSVGSGTRNAAMGSIGIDSSWANGDNIGNEWTAGAFPQGINIGPDHRYDNCEGSGELQNALINTRLGIGYNGQPGAGTQASSGNAEMLNVAKDIDGDGDGLADALPTDYVRMSLDKILHNSDPKTSWQIGGPETFVTRGDPFGTDLDIIPGGAIEIPKTNSHPGMANQSAAAYIRNMVNSIDAFVSVPGGSATFFMPGEGLANGFFLNKGLDNLPSISNPSQYVANAALNTTLQNYIGGNNTTTFPAFGAGNIAGKVPTRTANPNGAAYPSNKYSDGSSNGDYTLDGVSFSVIHATKLNERNQTAGDFEYSAFADRHKRNLSDITRMMAAIHNPRTFDTFDYGGNKGDVSADKAIAEILGDHNGDGNFDDKDVRYAADGLAIDSTTGQLDRKKGFKAVDDAWTYTDVAGRPAGNYFNTTLANPLKSYVSGDSRGDIAGAVSVPTPGANPVGSDGIINATDIDYVCFNTHWTEVGGLNKIKMVQPGAFSATQRPMNLSADLNGDLTVDSLDLSELVNVILGTQFGDVNLDGVVNQADKTIITSHLGQAGGWAAGDVNCDGMVTSADLDVYNLHVNVFAKADFNQDHYVNAADLSALNACASGPAINFTGQSCTAKDLDGDGDVDQADFGLFQKCYSGTKPVDPACE